MELFKKYQKRYKQSEETEYSVEEYLDLCKKDKLAYASPAERLLHAIGEPELVDTKNDPRLSRIFSNKVIKVYPAFKEFYGIEEAIEQVVSYFRHSAQGLEESKQILYLLGPTGSAKSSIAEKLKALMEQVPFYAIKGSPVNDSPLSLFTDASDMRMISEEYGIPEQYLKIIPSPWLVKRLEEAKGDIRKFTVVKRYPSILRQIAIAKVEPSDDSNADISVLVGKVDIRKLEDFSQDDPDAYGYSGGLCSGNRGLMEFVEIFKSPIKVLHPLLTATQEKNYKGTEGMGAIPFDGIVCSHSNEAEWSSFKNDKKHEAFIDRMCVIKIPYCLRVDEEIKIYEKLLRNSSLSDAPCAPETLKMLAQFSVLTRLEDPKNSSVYSKLKVYNGESLKDTDPDAKSKREYADYASQDEGMHGFSTRSAFKILSKVFNFDQSEIAANPIHLLYVLEQAIEKEQYPAEIEDKYTNYLKEHIATPYIDVIGKDIQTAYLESYSEFGQSIFDRYVMYADNWISDQEFVDADTGNSFDREALNKELESIEKPAGISNPKDFRNEIVNFVLRARAKNGGKNTEWTAYPKLKGVIEKKLFSKTEDLLPVISFSAKASEADNKKHEGFLQRMVDRGYTKKQTRLLCEWFVRVRKSS